MKSIEKVVNDLMIGISELEGKMKRRVLLVGDDSDSIKIITDWAQNQPAPASLKRPGSHPEGQKREIPALSCQRMR